MFASDRQLASGIDAVVTRNAGGRADVAVVKQGRFPGSCRVAGITCRCGRNVILSLSRQCLCADCLRWLPMASGAS